jgi:hypothetical protein
VADQITYDTEKMLSAPDGAVLEGINVIVEIEPKDAGCIIYGWLPSGDLQPIEFHGARTEYELPFARPQIFVKYLLGLKHLRISTVGYLMRR